MNQRVRARIIGRVQGVGFRPAVYRYATQLGLHGFVCNDSQGVTLEVEGEEQKVTAFFHQLAQEPPRQSVITTVETEVLEAKGYEQFDIVDSAAFGDARVHISPDLATCDDCLRELFDPADRRHGYPFINCTNCGPRFTIIRSLPYDRARTSMAGFTMCEPCAGEYQDPLNRRFHAQPDACDCCGPRLQLRLQDGTAYSDRALARAIALLRRGQIVAVKGLGGYHLACDATRRETVAELRRRKFRPHKPLAVMFPDLATLKQFCEVNEAEEAELLSVARPIVILKRRSTGVLEHGSDGKGGNQNSITPSLHYSISPDSPTVGAFLPYTPLHHLLLREFKALVMTSGNLQDEPIISSEDDLDLIFGPIADAALIHNRPIAHPCDDTVLRVVAGQRQLIRRARGFVPNPVRLAGRSPQILAVGGELKNTFCLVRDGFAFLSQHVGDLKDYKTYGYFAREIDSWKTLMRVEPEAVAHDLHPAYLSTRYAAKSGAPQLVGVQHHHAHVASVMAEHGLDQPVIGVALDGTGYGTDGTIWGGEFLVADRRDFERAAHFKPYPLPGADKAVVEPWRMAVSVLWCEGLADAISPHLTGAGADELPVIRRMIETGFNSPMTSSAGRLFDAVSALLGLRRVTSYEAQAAIQLEAIVDPAVTDAYPFALLSPPWPAVLDFGPAIRALLEDRSRGVPAGTIAARFHNAVAAAIVRVCESIRERRAIDVVALSGGVFQNVVLLTRTVAALQAKRFKVYTNTAVPPNDGGLALGQAAVAVARLERRTSGKLEDGKNGAASAAVRPTFHPPAEVKPCA